ncbi:hypothetical protein HRR83_006918 [Exophiala dermatitidis]|nr:hypothetical protein HRR75_005886 [Exophiala dermatitidis]KAJ4512402.1 hypothetical protein HRR73_005957 [Exophiala dermatitidis]KAJ4512724.1 hypothetical protein HRR74_006422 [Exophiala dermatitidis]KAJ4546547.1 hypothetical protein HRR78_005548 [Exophiala dermatitidis]KAJ4579891.1 hypothetical protein HRR81_002054 [Exophiala dermatitidis]
MARYDPFSPTFDHPLLNSSPDYGSRNGTFRNRPIGADLGAIAPQLSFRERNKRLRGLEEEKNQLIEDLLLQLETTQSQLDRLQLDHSREAQFNREGQIRENALHEQLLQVKTIMDRSPYIMVLLDGDGMIFTKDLLCKGENGGKEAASNISSAVDAFVAQHLPHLRSPNVVTRIYANVKSLSETLSKLKIIERTSLLDEFARGLNSAELSFDFVDAGSRSKEKVRDQFNSHLYNCHCHQIILGCSSDSHYTNLLEETAQDATVLDHVTILESVPFDKDFLALKDHFKTLKMENVFRNTKLGPCPMPKGPLQAVTATLPALSRVESNGTSGTASGSSTPAMTWATMTAQPFIPSAPASKASTTRTSTPTSMRSPEAVVSKPVTKGIERNRYGQRVDKVDSSIPNHEIQRIKKLKLCNIFYLQGPSFCTSNNCSHSHTYPLSKGERSVLREVARMTPCYYKLDCSDPECIYGHRCPQNKPDENGCWYGEDCRFYGWGHAIDTRVVKTTKV